MSTRDPQEEAIRLALEGRWEEAVRLNRAILERDPDNVEALNRLGKALFELRRYDEAYAAYGRVLELDPYNRIARKNRERLTSLLKGAPSEGQEGAREREQILPDLFISESGKSAVVPLRGVAPPAVLHRLSRGEILRLEPEGHNVIVKTADGTPLGRLDPRVGHRLAQFIQIGNRYAAAVAECSEDDVKVFIREIYQHPRLVGRLSFPPLPAAERELVRPYIRDLGLRLEEAFEAELPEELEEEETEEGLEEGEEEIEEEEELEEGLEEEEEEFIEEL
ncbi:MAG: tetratricopeptide repeat protein, partial [Chloroflexia bacterium]